MSVFGKNVNVMYSRGIYELVPIEVYQKAPENVDYETALKIIKEIQNILKGSSNDRKIVYDICHVFSKYKIYK